LAGSILSTASGGGINWEVLEIRSKMFACSDEEQDKDARENDR
jgi:hypothetical protein